MSDRNVRQDLRDHIDSSAPMDREDVTELTEELDPGVTTDATEMNETTVQDLPQAAIDGGWQYAQHDGNAEQLSEHDTQVVSDIESGLRERRFWGGDRRPGPLLHRSLSRRAPADEHPASVGGASEGHERFGHSRTAVLPPCALSYLQRPEPGMILMLNPVNSRRPQLPLWPTDLREWEPDDSPFDFGQLSVRVLKQLSKDEGDAEEEDERDEDDQKHPVESTAHSESPFVLCVPLLNPHASMDARSFMNQHSGPTTASTAKDKLLRLITGRSSSR